MYLKTKLLNALLHPQLIYIERFEYNSFSNICDFERVRINSFYLALWWWQVHLSLFFDFAASSISEKFKINSPGNKLLQPFEHLTLFYLNPNWINMYHTQTNKNRKLSETPSGWQTVISNGLGVTA